MARHDRGLSLMTPARRRRHPPRAVRARFSVREVPGITVAATGDRRPLPYGLDGTARRTAQRALTEAGRAYLGGHVELRAPRHLPARTLRRATARAVTAAVTTTLRTPRPEAGPVRRVPVPAPGPDRPVTRRRARAAGRGHRP